jgi:hypothetical protein
MAFGNFVRIATAAMLVTVAIAVLPARVWAQPATEYQPGIGQEGKDVVWVPTDQLLVNKILDLANVTANDFVIDLGSGDGRTVITAAKRGAKALGIEYNPDMVELSKRNAIKEGVADKVTFAKADIFESDFSQASVITLFLLPKLNVELRPKILNMKPGVRVVSNTFEMGDWVPDARDAISGDCMFHCAALLWIVPAKVQGTWKMPRGKLILQQKYQMLSGKMKIGNVTTTIKEGKMIGDQIAFSVDGTRYTGRVNGGAMEGISKSATRETKWLAKRSG